MSKPTIIIIGAGYAGAKLASELETSGFYRILLIERNAYYSHNVAALRASVQASWIDNAILPYNQLFHNSVNHSQVIQGTVTRIATETQEVHLANTNHPIHYDYLVIATGASYSFPGKLNASSAGTAKSVYTKLGHDISQAKHVLIVGGGPVGVELAGEIAAQYNADSGKRKQITLVHSGPHLLSARPDIKESVGHKLQQILEQQLHVAVLLNDVVTVPESLKSAQKLYINTPTDLTTKTGKQIKADLILVTVGGKPNTQWLYDSHSFPNQIFDSTGHVKVDDYLRVGSGDMNVKYSNIFALGDVANFQPGMSFYGDAQAKSLAKNLINLSRNKPFKPIKKAATGLMSVPLGSALGATQLPMFGGIRVGSTMTSMVKGKALFVDPNKSMLHIK